MHRYRTIIRTLFALIFIGGGISHLILGRSAGSGYAVFGDTALLGWLTQLWSGFVMPNIGWLTILLALFELSIGIGLLLNGRLVKAAVAAMLVFFGFLLILGYGYPTASALDDFLKNRVGSLVMAALVLPILLGPEPSAITTAWRRFVGRVGREQLVAGN